MGFFFSYERGLIRISFTGKFFFEISVQTISDEMSSAAEKNGNTDNTGLFSIFLHQNICCDPLLELSW